MPSRIDVELTSARPDGTWTWRAAGAREPKGVVESAILPSGAKVGDVYRVEATIALDGIEIHAVVPGRTNRKEPERLEILGGGEFQAVTTSLVGRRERDSRGPGDRRDRRDKRDRRDGDRRPAGEGRPRRDGQGGHDDKGERSGRREGREQGERSDRPPRERRPPRTRPSYAPVPEVPQRPKAKRLRPGRVHRQALMASLPQERQVVAEQLFRAGLPGVRQALKEQNAALAAEGKPEINTSGIESLAQDLLPAVRVAEWLDRADAAQATVDDLDLRDLRSVVTAAADPMVARDDTTRELAGQLRAALDRRQNEEYDQWLGDIAAALEVGRVVRALRLSSRPPKAGVPFPPELAARLAESATAALAPDAASDRWVAVVEALAFSPVHAVVAPAAAPQVVTDDLTAMVKGVASAVPNIAALLGIEVPPPGSRPPRAPRLPRRPTKPKAKTEGRTRPPDGRTPPPPPPPPDRPAASAEEGEAPSGKPPAPESLAEVDVDVEVEVQSSDQPSPPASESAEPAETVEVAEVPGEAAEAGGGTVPPDDGAVPSEPGA